MRTSGRAIVVALLAVALAGFAPAAAPAHAAPLPAQAVHAAPIAIDLGELFGDENEPDENEPDEGSDQPAQQSRPSSGLSLPVVAILVLAAAALGGFVFLRVRRAYLRLRGWTHQLWARD